MTDDTRKLIGINKLLSLLETLKKPAQLGRFSKVYKTLNPEAQSQFW
jgi:hypothetical protein